MPMIDSTLIARFLAKVSPEPNTGCWLWTANIDSDGYGIFSVRRKNQKAHRVSHELFKGPIPDAHTIDHLCHNGNDLCLGGSSCIHRSCVNPDHIEPATIKLNTLRGNSISARLAKQTHCKRGHEFTEENTYRSPKGGRMCRLCHEVLRIESRRKLLQGERIFQPSAKTHCARGHEFTPQNTRISYGQRHCIICSRAACLRSYHKNK